MPVLLLVTPVPLFATLATLATATPRLLQQTMLAPARQGNTPHWQQVRKQKCTIMRLPYSNRPPSPRTQTNWQKAHPSAASPSCHRSISQDPQNIVCLSGSQQRHSSRHVVRHASRTFPIPNFSASKQSDGKGMLQMQRVSDSLATRRAAAPGTAQQPL
ncbi:hypothetical protein F5882DRAFT_396289 [Hyaloscypha sp. PMI_1271]|nr:hypothetical protein F5882DRAFT_396289 [Hyaloscypha sp. PMI_1271]